MRTWLRRTALGVAGTATFVTALVAGAIYHLDLPLGRRAINGAAGLALSGLPAKEKHVTLGRIERTPTAIVLHDVDADFSDEYGRPAISVRGATAKVRYVDLLRGWISTGTLTVELDEVHARSIDVALDDDGGGSMPRVARAFVDPKAPPSPPSDPNEKASFHLVIAGLTVDHVWAHGALAGVYFDEDLDALQGGVFIGDDVRVRIEDADITARALPREANVRVRGLVVVPKLLPVQLMADVDGVVGGAPIHVRAFGDLVRLDAIAHATTGTGEADVRGALWLPSDKTALTTKAYVRTRDVPLRIADPSLPDGTVSVEAIATATLADVIEASGKVRSEPTIIAAGW
jgi:hypothetical protein